MTQKDYILLARTMRRFMEDYHSPDINQVMRLFMSRLGTMLKEDNPNFSQQKFYNAVFPDDYPNT